MGPIDRKEIINDMTYAISLSRHAIWAHFKIDIEIVTSDMGFLKFDMRHWGPRVKGPLPHSSGLELLLGWDVELLTNKTQLFPRSLLLSFLRIRTFLKGPGP